MELGRVLCPVDFSEPSRQALLRAAWLARGATALELLHVYEPPASADPAETVRALADIDRALGEWAGWARELGVPTVTTRSVQGAPWREIVARASEGDFDLLVMGTHGRTGIRRAVIGSVAEKVVRTAPCDVLTVRAP